MPDVSAYTDVLVPRLLAPWAEVLVDALDPVVGTTVVDVATGPGTVARAVARRLRRIGRVLACDPRPALLAAARATAAERGAAPIEYARASAEALPYPDAVASGVTCQCGLQFVTDPVRALAQMRRVTAPGGRLVVATWREPADSPMFAAMWDAAVPYFGADGSQPPWSVRDTTALSELARQAGWQQVEVVERDLPIEFGGGPAEVVEVLALTRIRARLAALDPDARAVLVRRTADALGSLVEGDGAVRSRTGAHFLLARA